MELTSRSSFWKAATFVLYAGINCAVPFLPIFYHQKGLSTAEIGLVGAVFQIASAISPPLFASVADKRQQHRLILLLLCVSSSIAFVCFLYASVLLHFLVIAFVYAALWAPVTSLLDSYVLDSLRSDQNSYGSRRLWGSLACGVTPVFVGKLIDSAGAEWMFLPYCCFFFVFFVLGVCMPRVLSAASSAQEPVKATNGSGLVSTQFVLFLLHVLIVSMGLTFINLYLFIFMLEDLHASTSLIGWAVTCTVLGEPIIFVGAKPLLQRVGVRVMVVSAQLLLVLRLVAYAFIRDDVAVLPVQLLHGVIFALFWAAAVAHVNAIAPVRREATAIAVLSAVYGGVGPALGSAVGGWIYHAWGPRFLFMVGGLGVLLSAVIFLLTHRTPESTVSFYQYQTVELTTESADSMKSSQSVAHFSIADSDDEVDSINSSPDLGHRELEVTVSQQTVETSPDMSPAKSSTRRESDLP
eukprot:GILK01009000.1.p1 GENE.GILK01009000.1~~GILK01009000.1.p1  ORF type:complete len:467 (+),score=67.58 GILK01009000.1:137-1537(+)